MDICWRLIFRKIIFEISLLLFPRSCSILFESNLFRTNLQQLKKKELSQNEGIGTIQNL